MNKSLIKLIALISLTLLGYTSAIACTNITLKAKDNSIMVGRTMEFAANLESNIVVSPRGREFSSVTPSGDKGLSWKSKFGYLILDYFNTKHAVDGMNQQGLSFGYLYLPEYTDYPMLTAENVGQSLPYYSLGDWVLGNFSTVDQVKKAIASITIYDKPQTIQGKRNVTFPMHAIVTDAKGNSIVIEFTKGKTKVYNAPLGVMTNAPTYTWQLNNLKNYASLSPYSPSPIKVDGYTYSGTGQGSGMVGLPGDYTPPSRFVKMTLLSKYSTQVDNAAANLTLARHILNTVDIPIGAIRATKGSDSPADKTQWTVYKDLTNRILYFTSYTNSALQSIDMSKLDFSPDAKVLTMPVESEEVIIDATKNLS